MAAETSYHRLALGEKQVAHRDRMREPALRCPHCEAQTTVTDLLRHVATTCPGPRAPHPLSRWVSWREALELGVEPWRMSRWIDRGMVRARGARRGRQYLLRDIAVHLAERRRPWLQKCNQPRERR